MPAGLTRGGPSPARIPWLLIGLVTLVGLAVRAIPVALADFPVNDGGLFLAMTRAIQDAGWALPATVAWNGNALPFAYPPLAFYGAGALEAVLGIDLLTVFRWMPLVASTLIVPAVFLLGRAVLRSDLGGVVAALAYALAPASYVWMIQGGGITRSPGLLLAVLAVWQSVFLVREPTRRRTVVVGLLAGMTALIHPAAALFAAISGVLLLVFEGRSRESLAHATAALGVAALVALPWAAIVISRHGFAALTDVPSNGPDPVTALLAVFAGRVTGIPFVSPLALVGAALVVLALLRRQWFLPLWFAASLVLSYQYAMIPFGMLIGVLVVDLVALRARDHEPAAADKSVRWIPVFGVVALATCFVIEGVGSAATVLNPSAPVHALSADRRLAMAEVAAMPDGTFAVITGSEWSGDPDSEWFPLLADHPSVATVQGAEWLGQEAFEDQVIAYRALQACVPTATSSCVSEWLDLWPADYLYLPNGRLHGPNAPPDCCTALREALRTDPAFTVIYDESGGTIFVDSDLTRSEPAAER